MQRLVAGQRFFCARFSNRIVVLVGHAFAGKAVDVGTTARPNVPDCIDQQFEQQWVAKQPVEPARLCVFAKPRRVGNPVGASAQQLGHFLVVQRVEVQSFDLLVWRNFSKCLLIDGCQPVGLVGGCESARKFGRETAF